jgi:hypothetical protein
MSAAMSVNPRSVSTTRSSDVTASDTGYKVAAGFRPLDIVAGEVNYVSFGRANGGENFADTDGIGVSGLLFLPIPLIDVYGRVGLFNWRVDASSPGDSFHRTGSDLAYGAGAGAHWGNLGARLEFEKFQVAGAKTQCSLPPQASPGRLVGPSRFQGG